jgi:hypothetical protein
MSWSLLAEDKDLMRLCPGPAEAKGLAPVLLPGRFARIDFFCL